MTRGTSVGIFIYFWNTVLLDGFTKDFRSFNLTFNREDGSAVTINFDLFLQNYIRTADLICQRFTCEPPDSLHLIANNYSRKILADYLRKNGTNSRPLEDIHWSKNIDPLSAMDYTGVSIEIDSLYRGEFRVRDYCNSTNSKNPMYRYNAKKCKFADLIRSHPSCPTCSSPEWIDLAEELFNHGEYIHSDAISRFVLSRITPDDSVTDTNSAASRAWSILAEVSKLRGRLQDSCFLDMKVLQR